MFERFTDNARRMVMVSQEAARSLGSDVIDTEHLLLGLAAPPATGVSVGQQALADMGFTPEKITQGIHDLISYGPGGTPTGHVPFTKEAKRVIELSLRQALSFGHNYIGSEHLLLALLQEDTNASAVLEHIDVSAKNLLTSAVKNQMKRIETPVDPPVRIALTQTEGTQLVNWLYMYRSTFGPLADSHPAELLIRKMRP